MSQKVKTSTNIHTDTKQLVENGLTETVVTRTITDNYSDGSSSTRKEIHTTKDETVPGASNNTGNNSGNSYSNQSSYSSQMQQDYQRREINTGAYNSGLGSGPIMRSGSGGNLPQMSELKTDESFINEALACHNKYRGLHQVPPLTISRDLCKAAQTWADTLASKGSMENSHYGYGENIYWSSAPGQAMKGDVPVEYWYHEQSHFDWSQLDFQKTTGSFTQVIWKDTKSFGIAKSSGSKGCYVVAFYIPPGNVLGKFRDNVHRAS